MKIYKRNGRYLIVLGDIPQWLIVDRFGAEVAKDIINNVPLKAICKKYPLRMYKEVNKTYEELFPVVNQITNRDSPAVENMLTAKTTVAMIAVTRNCNLQSICPHCYIDAGGSRAIELSLKEHKNLAIQIKKYLTPDSSKIYKVNLTGGEPFFNPKIIRIIEAYRNVGLEVNMSTNGLLIKDDDMVALASMKVVLSVSLDGASATTHDFIRGPGSWNKVINKIKKLIGAGVKVGVNCLLHEGNFSEIEQIIALVHGLGCSGFNPINLVQLGRACRSNLHRVSETELFKRIANHLTQYPEQLHLFDGSSLFSSLGAALFAGITCESCGVGNRPCVYVDETGGIYPCPNTQKKEFLLGNIRKMPLSDCIKINHPVLERFRLLRVDSINERCAKCDVRFFCGGDCRGETYNVTGDLSAPYVACVDRHDSIIELMWIVADHPEFFEKRASEYISNVHRF